MMTVNVNCAHTDISFKKVGIVSQELFFPLGARSDFIKICVNCVKKIILLELPISVFRLQVSPVIL